MFTGRAKNIRFFKWVPGKLIISKADLIIFHGGYGTMMESIGYGKRTITVPFHSKQEGNGRRLEQLDYGSVLKPAEESSIELKANGDMGDMLLWFKPHMI